ncbi:MAG: hypothetical protein RBR16_09440 [Syntrophus sp. (in: bacteria)]|nr:hypothetical protein [Syntrophus sp. (in: bacteria)]
MAIQSPSKLETIDYGQQWWQHIFNANAQKENEIFNKLQGLWDGTATEGQVAVWDSAIGKWKPSAAPYPVPQSAVALTIGTGADTTVNTVSGKFFTIIISKVTNFVFTNFVTGMVIDLVLTQDATGGFVPTFASSVVVGTINTDPNISTWLRIYKIDTTIMVNVVANFTL